MAYQSKHTLGDTIRSLRKTKGMTQEDLADGVCSAVSVSMIENGTQMPSSRVLERLLERLGTSTYALCNIGDFVPGGRDLPLRDPPSGRGSAGV